MRTIFAESGTHAPKKRLRDLLTRAVEILTPLVDMGDGPEWSLHLEFHSDLQRIVGTTDGEAMGATLAQPDLDDRVVTVALKMGSRFQVLQALAHEMVHVAQVARGDLRTSDERPGVVIWKGAAHHIAHPLAKIMIMLRGYENLPWEIEAFERMDELFVSVFSELDPADQAWVINSTRS